MKLRLFAKQLITAFTVALFAVSPFAFATDSTTLENGAELSVTLDTPADEQEYRVPAAGGPGATIDVPIDGAASIGEGDPNVAIVFVVDVSGSTDDPCGGETGLTILGCEKQAVQNVLDDPNIQSVLEVGVAVYGESGAAADMELGTGDQLVTDPNASIYADTVVASIVRGGVNSYAVRSVGYGSTNFTAGLNAAASILTASTADIKFMVYVSDGEANTGASGFAAAVAAVNDTGATAFTYAIGSGSSCTGDGDGTLQGIADGVGDSPDCEFIENPADLPAILPDLLASQLLDVQVSVGGSDIVTTTVPAVPLDGPVSTDFSATTNQGVGDYEIGAEATGLAVFFDDQQTVEEYADIHLLQLTASPESETNELSEDNEHTVYGQILGGTGLARDIVFDVSGANLAGSPVEATPGAAAVSFEYTVPKACTSLGTDTIDVSTTIAGEEDSVELTKDWLDTIPPEAECVETVNPHGNTTPQAPGQGGQAQNQDGFYKLLATDNLVAGCDPLELFVTDTGSGTVFGPYPVGTKIKYTEDSTAIPEAKKIGSDKGKADAVDVHIIGNGDPQLTATDQSGNTSVPVSCLVPPPPM